MGDRKEWMRLVFLRFSHGPPGMDDESWMTSFDMLNFARLVSPRQCGLRKPKFQRATLDIIFTKLTHKLNVGSTTIDYRHIKFEDFYHDFIRVVSRIQYPGIPTKEAVERFFEEFFYVNVVTNLPYLGVRDRVMPQNRQKSLMQLFSGLPRVEAAPEAPLTVWEDSSGHRLDQNKSEEEFRDQEAEERLEFIGKFEEAPHNSSLLAPLNLLISPRTEDFNPESREVDAHPEPLRMGEQAVPRKEQGLESELLGQGTQLPTSVRDLMSQAFQARHINKLILNTRSNQGSVQQEVKEEQPSSSKCDSCLTKTIVCLSKVPWLVLKCLRSCFAFLFSCINSSPELMESSDSEQLNDTNEAAFDETENGARRNRKESPEWSEIVHLTVEWFQELLEEARKLASSTTVMIFNTTNIIAILSHGFEVITFSAVAFDVQVGWFSGGSGMSKGSEVVLAQNDYFEATFWTVFAITIIFGVLAYPALKLAKQGKLGMMENNQKAAFPSWRFVLGKLVMILAKSLYFTVMKALLDVFACREVNGDWVVLRNSDMVCFSSAHLPLVFCSMLSIVLYYPTATLLYPNLQYQDKSLDIKYDTTFLVIESQGKLILSAFSAFFASELYLTLKLIVYIVVCTVLTVICVFVKPCIVKSYNLWKAGGYAAACWCCCWALVNYTTAESVRTT
jgi:hypothetical protein